MRGRHVSKPIPVQADPGRRTFLKSGLTVATIGATGVWLAEPAAAAGNGFRLALDKRRYEAGQVARLTIHEGVDFQRRMLVSGPQGLTWHKVGGGRNHSVFAARVRDSGPVTVHLTHRITGAIEDTAQLSLEVHGVAGQNLVGGAFVAYETGSFFQSRVDNAPVDGAATAAFRTFMKSHPDQRAIPFPTIRGTNGNAWGMPFAMSDTADPQWRLTGSVPSPVSKLATEGFAAPEWFGTVLTGTADSPMVIIDRKAGRTIWAANAKVVGSKVISVSAAGYFEHASNGLDTRNPRSDNQANYRSRGAIPDAMVIRKDLVDPAIATGGDLGHVLHMMFVETNSAAGFCHPMVGAEHGKGGFGAEGLRIAIDPHVNVEARGLSPEGVVIARTLQRHGCYLGDNSGSGSGLKAEQENSHHNVWGGRLPATVLSGLRWDDFVVLPKGWQ